MEGQHHGRFFAEHLPVREGADLPDRIQEALDAGDRKEWHLVGVSDVPNEGLILFRDTARSSFGRSGFASS